MLSKITIASTALLATSSAAQVDEWKKRAVYQVLTDRFAQDNDGSGACGNLSQYCGGTYKGMINHLDYIQGMGFDAIWISPVIDNQEPGYHGYWGRDWNKTNDHFGSSDDLKNLVKACHDKGIYVMVDVVANHVAPVGNNFSSIQPFNSPDHYHANCAINDWGNQWQVENCRLADLPDLNQQNDWVRGQLKDWVKNLVNDYGFDGIRIDTIPEVPKDFWSEYGQAAGVFQMGEVFNGDPAYVGGYQGPVTALFNYPMYYTIRDVFGSKQSMYGIKNRYNEEGGHFSDIDALGLFVDNHDNARFLNQYNDQKMFANALVFSLTGRGIPFYYYGSEQAYAGGNDPQNRESLW
jgi:alpha-amylase